MLALRASKDPLFPGPTFSETHLYSREPIYTPGKTGLVPTTSRTYFYSREPFPRSNWLHMSVSLFPPSHSHLNTGTVPCYQAECPLQTLCLAEEEEGIHTLILNDQRNIQENIKGKINIICIQMVRLVKPKCK